MGGYAGLRLLHCMSDCSKTKRHLLSSCLNFIPVEQGFFFTLFWFLGKKPTFFDKILKFKSKPNLDLMSNILSCKGKKCPTNVFLFQARRHVPEPICHSDCTSYHHFTSLCPPHHSCTVSLHSKNSSSEVTETVPFTDNYKKDHFAKSEM